MSQSRPSQTESLGRPFRFDEATPVMVLTNNVSLLYDALLTVVYPQACAICQRSVERRELGVACEDCWRETRVFTDDDTFCWRCGTPSIAGVDESNPRDVRCHRCDSYTFSAARACGLYEKALRESVLSLKRQPYVPKRIAHLLMTAAQREPLNESTLIIPVPLHDAREKARGFNQALIVARVLSRSLDLPVNEVSLIRTSHAEKYRAGLDAKGRTDTVARAFEVIHPRLISGEKILVVDDVFTTGATAAACSSVLNEAGAEMVYVLTIARTVK